ncbi:H-type small acid-soluble spore protein [Clostridium sp. MSJ-4]|uniref:H-type small acid-soluble spore protein n=1 Tax=Clostridium simiarum TaxID=2841506 RepID=A0ABS6F397_9CLOT|nr:H-type small acid-soluble spore protein [Clostridium simiarum]MBU5592781.1 H-type small acid-soluble spore protein [Clostridium simiarum]
MDIKRATEIVKSLGVIDVNYKGNSVWIENINQKDNEAVVKDLKTNKEFPVDISQLEEGNDK